MSSHVSPLRRCCISILESLHTSSALAIAAARAIEADAQLNVYFHSQKTSGASSSDLLQLLEEDEQMSDSVEAAYAAFESQVEHPAEPLVRALERYHELARQRVPADSLTTE